MRIHILTLFPEMFRGPLDASIVARAVERGVVEIHIHNIRDWSHDPHHTVDDSPYGGGPGMVMKPEPIFAAVDAIDPQRQLPVILLSPQGRLFNQREAQRLAGLEGFILLCGHYEGVDERVVERLAHEELSIGDYVLTGGELPAMIVVDAVVRLLPGALTHPESAADDSHTTGLLQHPQYTRPQNFTGWEVPSVLLSGNHAQIARWRREQSLLRTFLRRPELLERAPLSEEDREFLDTVREQFKK